MFIIILSFMFLWNHMFIIIFNFNLTFGIMVNVLASSAVERGFKRVCQTKDYKIGICWFSEALRSKNKDWVDQNNVSEWSDMSTHWLVASVS
jgi:hypothetical protein